MKNIHSLLVRFPAFFKAGTAISLLIAGAVLVTLTNCTTKKQFLKTETETKIQSEQTATEKEATKADNQTLSTIAENVKETNNVIIAETITELSKPDSTGKQHIEKITTRQIENGKNKETQTNSQVITKTVIEGETIKSENETVKTEIEIKDQSKTITKTKKIWPFAISTIIAALVIFIIIKFKWIFKI